jgi:primosomal protein N' (replication factor Y)
MSQDSPFSAAAPVLVPMPAERPYTYAVPDGMRVVPGSIVRVPLGPRQVAGVVWDGGADPVDARKLRPIEQVFDCPPISRDMRRFGRPAWWRVCCCARRKPSTPSRGPKASSSPTGGPTG